MKYRPPGIEQRCKLDERRLLTVEPRGPEERRASAGVGGGGGALGRNFMSQFVVPR